MKLDGGRLIPLKEVINITFHDAVKDYGVLEIDTTIRDNGNIKTGLYISGTGEGRVYLRPKISNAFTGGINLSRRKTLILEFHNGAITVSGDMNVERGAKLVSRRSGQIAKHFHVTLESRGVSQHPN